MRKTPDGVTLLDARKSSALTWRRRVGKATLHLHFFPLSDTTIARRLSPLAKEWQIHCYRHGEQWRVVGEFDNEGDAWEFFMNDAIVMLEGTPW